MADDLDNLLAELNSGRLAQRPQGAPQAAPVQALKAAPKDELDAVLSEQGLDASGQEARPAGPPLVKQAGGGGAQTAYENQDNDGAFGAFGRGLLDTALFGFSDEITGTLNTALNDHGGEDIWNSKRSFSDILSSNIAHERATLEADREHHFKAGLGGQIVGGLLVPFGVGAKGALQVAKVGAVQGAAYGLGSGTTLESRLMEAGKDAVIGGVAGGVLGKVVDTVAPYASKAWNAVTGRGAKALEEDAGQLLDQAGARINPDGTLEIDVVGGQPAAQAEREVVGWTEPNASGERQPILAEVGPTTSGAAKASDVAHEEVPLTAPATLEAPLGEHVGSISRAGLEELQAKVQGFRDRVDNPEGLRGREVDITPSNDPVATASVGQFRLGNLGDGPDTMSLLGALARQLPSKGVRSDAQLMESAKAAAEEMGVGDPEALRALATQIAGPLGDADTAIATLRTVQRQAADQIDVFHGSGIDWTTASDEMVQQAGAAIFNVQQLNSLVQTAKVGVGRALRVFSLPNSEEYLKALAKAETLTPANGPRNIPALPGTREEMKDFFELWGMTKRDPESQMALLQGTLTVPTASKYLQASAANLFTASILSAPKTIVLNLVGPALVNTVRNLERMGGGALGALNPFATATERAAQAEVAKQAPLALFRTLGDIQDAFRYGVQAFKENGPALGGGGTIRDAAITFGPYNENMLRAAGADPDWRYTLGNVLNIFPKAFAKLNNGLDETAKRLTYMGETRLRAQVEAATRGLEGRDAQAFVADALRNATDEAGAATDQAVLRSAEQSTLTGQVGAEGSFGRKFAEHVQTLRTDYPLTRFILPVFNVPANALGATMRRIPLLERMPGFPEHAADLAGENGPVAQAEAHGRALLGASFLTAGYLLNQAGLLTGAGPQNPQDARVWRQTHEPYSIRVGDTWVSYRKLDIAGGLLSIPATISDVSVYQKAEDQELSDMMLMGAASLATWFKDQASLRSAMTLLTLGDNPTQDPGRALTTISGNILSGSVPGSGFIRTMGVDTTDPYVRMKRSWTDYLKAGFPGLSEELEPMRNILGEPINRTANSLGEAILPVTMAPVATYAKEPVLDELTRLYRVTGYGMGSDPKSYLYGFADTRDVKLEDGRSLHYHAMQARAHMRLDGMTLKETLGALFNSAAYDEAVDAGAQRREASEGVESRGYLVRRVFDRFNKQIKAELGASSPLALKYLTAAAAKQRDGTALRTASLEDLVNNPDLYRANRVDPEAYSAKVTEGAAGDLLEALGPKERPR